MKTNLMIPTLALATLAMTGCYTPQGEPDNTASGALAGGAMGAATGAIIGSASHSAGAGALIGAGAGALLGGLLGHSADEEQDRRLRAQAPATYVRVQQGGQLTLSDVKALAKARVNDDTIIAQITVTHTIFHPNATDIIDLHDAGLSQRLIDFIINTPTTISPAPSMEVLVPAPPPVAQPDPIVMAPGPDYVWIGGEWVWRGGWVWAGGHWALPPYPRAVWVGGYWAARPHGWIRVNGYWR